MEDCNLLHSITADRGISDHEETKDFFIFQNIAKIDTNVANTNFCNIFAKVSYFFFPGISLGVTHSLKFEKSVFFPEKVEKKKQVFFVSQE